MCIGAVRGLRGLGKQCDITKLLSTPGVRDIKTKLIHKNSEVISDLFKPEPKTIGIIDFSVS